MLFQWLKEEVGNFVYLEVMVLNLGIKTFYVLWFFFSLVLLIHKHPAGRFCWPGSGTNLHPKPQLFHWVTSEVQVFCVLQSKEQEVGVKESLDSLGSPIVWFFFLVRDHDTQPSFKTSWWVSAAFQNLDMSMAQIVIMWISNFGIRIYVPVWPWMKSIAATVWLQWGISCTFLYSQNMDTSPPGYIK